MNLSNVVIETDRLRLVPVKEKFLEQIFNELTPEITKYLSFDATGDIKDTLTFLQDSQPKIQNGEDMPLAVFDKNTGEFIGCSGAHSINTKTPSIGIWIKKSDHRKGYGKEIVAAVIEWIHKNIQYDHIIYPVAKANQPSRKLIESLGGIAAKEQMFTSSTGKTFEEIEYHIYPKAL